MPFILSIDHGRGARRSDPRDFTALFGVRYLPQLLCSDWRVERYLRQRCSQAHKRGAIDELGLWLAQLHKKELVEGPDIDITIRWMDARMGYGLWTNSEIPAWHYIGEYTGVLRRRTLLKVDVNDYCFQYPRSWLGLRAFTIDSALQGNHTRFINHSDSPNVESRAFFHEGLFHIALRSIRAIPRGSQLTYDYG